MENGNYPGEGLSECALDISVRRCLAPFLPLVMAALLLQLHGSPVSCHIYGILSPASHRHFMLWVGYVEPQPLTTVIGQVGALPHRVSDSPPLDCFELSVKHTFIGNSSKELASMILAPWKKLSSRETAGY